MCRLRVPGACLLLLPALLLAGCVGLADVAPEAAGLGAGAGAGVLTANPLIGVAVGLGVRLATDEAISSIRRTHQRALQRAIADAAGPAPVEEWVGWSTTPGAVQGALFGTVSGRAQVTREFGGRIRCRELLYSIDGDGGVVGDVDETGADIGTAADALVQPIEHDDNRAGTPAGSAEPEATSGSAHPAAQVLVAVICRGSPAGRWTWAVSVPAVQN